MAGGARHMKAQRLLVLTACFLTSNSNALTTSLLRQAVFTSHDRSGSNQTARLALVSASGAAEDAADRVPAAQPGAYAAICSVLKNEHAHVEEWVRYHQWIGVGKIYIFDHGSQPPLATTLQRWVASGVVETTYFTDAWLRDVRRDPALWLAGGRTFLSPQVWAYDTCFRSYGGRHKFLALLDADEYVILRPSPHVRPNLPAFLKAYEPYGGVMVHWQPIGPSGHRVRPAAGTLASYTQCASRADLQLWRDFQANPLGHMKSFTNTRYSRGHCDPHRCQLQGNQYVNEDFQSLSRTIMREVHWDKIVIFHYVTRSGEDYGLKLKRGSGHSQFSPEARRRHVKNRGWKYFHMVNSTASVQCLEGTWMHRLLHAGGAQPQTSRPQQPAVTGSQSPVMFGAHV